MEARREVRTPDAVAQTSATTGAPDTLAGTVAPSVQAAVLDAVPGTSAAAGEVPSAPKKRRVERRKKFRKRKSPYVESEDEESSADENASFPTRFSPRNKRGYKY